MTLHIFCDQCSDMVDEVCLSDSQDILCLRCGNLLLHDIPTDKEKRISIARAIWGL